ncbi:hypothetical protein [Haloplanus halophilus]|uniref:hypothetical protein n=1 Tax=Haloplanus halophilus TaxID=2949993 RepID=UPI00203CB97C|nr:hypothetical protein [Haloplanus sp. GDY1]
MQLAQAETRADNADAREHIRAAREAIRAMTPTGLQECPVCGRVGVPNQIAVHDCDG